MGRGRKTGGKVKGSMETLRKTVTQKAAELGICPYEILLRFAQGDWKALGYESDVFIKRERITDSGADRTYERTIDPGVRMKAAAESSQYIFAKRRSIEKTSEYQNATPEEKLAALKLTEQDLLNQIEQKKAKEECTTTKTTS
jgi:hypothetical protein